MRLLGALLLSTVVLAQLPKPGGSSSGSSGGSGVPAGCSVSSGVLTCSGFNASSVVSGSVLFSGLTSGAAGFAVTDIAAATPILYLLPTTAGTAGQVLKDNGAVTCPTLAAGAPSLCHQLQWVDATNAAKFGSMTLTAPSAVAGWTQANSPSTFADVTGGVQMTCASDTASNFRAALKAIPTAPFTKIFVVSYDLRAWGTSSNNLMGLVLTDGTSSAAKAVSLVVNANGSYLTANVLSWDALSGTGARTGYPSGSALTGTYIGQVLGAGYNVIVGTIALKLVDDNTNWKFSYSLNGYDWYDFPNVTRNTFLTATHLGFGCSITDNTPAALMPLSTLTVIGEQ